MAERTLSIVIEVDGSQEAAAQVRRVRSALDDLGGGARDLERVARQSREVTQVMKEMGKTFDLRQRQKEMVGDLEDFFRRITTGARSAGDVLKNVWREVADYFRRVLREMATAATGGLGGAFPFASTFGAPTLASVFGLPATMPIGDVLSRLHGIGPFSGTQVGFAGSLLGGLTVGSSNRTLSALGGLGSGALTGFSVGGPIGAVVGGLIGGIVGLFSGGGGKEKRHDAEIANAGFAQLRQILDDYNHFRRDFASAVDTANRIWSQMASQWTRPQSAPSQRPFFDAIVRSMQTTEDERNRRRQLLAMLPAPEFQEGGFVTAHSRARLGGRVPAWLHEGEFVMNRQAVDRLGVSLLDGLNRGSGLGTRDSGMTISIDPDGSRWLEQNADALEKGIAVVLRRGGPVSRALRQ
jgi:hypothetical protein